MNGEASELEKEKDILKTALCIYKAEQGDCRQTGTSFGIASGI